MRLVLRQKLKNDYLVEHIELNGNVGLNSLRKKCVFGHMTKTPYDVKTSGYKWAL